jgi:hypothetical protein
MRNIAMENTSVVRPMTKIIAEYRASLQDHPNPPAAGQSHQVVGGAFGTGGRGLLSRSCQF